MELTAAAVGQPTVTYLVTAGERVLVEVELVETTGLDITTSALEIGLGSGTDPGTFTAGYLNIPGDTPDTRIISTLLDDSTPPGTYRRWVKVTDNPEVHVVKAPGRIVVK